MFIWLKVASLQVLMHFPYLLSYTDVQNMHLTAYIKEMNFIFIFTFETFISYLKNSDHLKYEGELMYMNSTGTKVNVMVFMNLILGHMRLLFLTLSPVQDQFILCVTAE